MKGLNALTEKTNNLIFDRREVADHNTVIAWGEYTPVTNYLWLNRGDADTNAINSVIILLRKLIDSNHDNEEIRNFYVCFLEFLNNEKEFCF